MKTIFSDIPRSITYRGPQTQTQAKLDDQARGQTATLLTPGEFL